MMFSLAPHGGERVPKAGEGRVCGDHDAVTD
jgi:hypothetical protein